jgi:hypothetical protein
MSAPCEDEQQHNQGGGWRSKGFPLALAPETAGLHRPALLYLCLGPEAEQKWQLLNVLYSWLIVEEKLTLNLSVGARTVSTFVWRAAIGPLFQEFGACPVVEIPYGQML